MIDSKIRLAGPEDEDPAYAEECRQLVASLGLGSSAAGSALGAPGRVAASKPDPRTKRDKVRRQRAAAAAKIDALRVDANQIDQAITDLEANTKARQADLRSAKDAEKQANQAVADEIGRAHV